MFLQGYMHQKHTHITITANVLKQLLSVNMELTSRIGYTNISKHLLLSTRSRNQVLCLTAITIEK